MNNPYNYRGMIHSGLVKKYKEDGEVETFNPNTTEIDNKVATTRPVEAENVIRGANPNFKKRNTLGGYLADFFIGAPLEFGTAPLEVVSGDIINWESRTDLGEKSINIGEGVVKGATEIAGAAVSTAYTGSPYAWMALKQAGKATYKGLGGKGAMEIEGVSTKYQEEDPGTKKAAKIIEDVIPMAYSFGTSKAVDKAGETIVEEVGEEVTEEVTEEVAKEVGERTTEGLAQKATEKSTETVTEELTEAAASELLDDPVKKMSYLDQLYSKFKETGVGQLTQQIKESDAYTAYKKAKKYGKKSQKYLDVATSQGQEKVNEYVRNLKEHEEQQRQEEIIKNTVTWQLPKSTDQTITDESILEEPKEEIMAKQGGMIAKGLFKGGGDVGGNIFNPIEDRDRLIPQKIMRSGGKVKKYLEGDEVEDMGGFDFSWADTTITEAPGMVEDELEFYSTEEGSFIGDQMIMSMDEIDAAMEDGTLEETFSQRVSAYEEMNSSQPKDKDLIIPEESVESVKSEKNEFPELLSSSEREQTKEQTLEKVSKEKPNSRNKVVNKLDNYLSTLNKGINAYSSIHGIVTKEQQRKQELRKQALANQQGGKQGTTGTTENTENITSNYNSLDAVFTGKEGGNIYGEGTDINHALTNKDASFLLKAINYVPRVAGSAASKGLGPLSFVLGSNKVYAPPVVDNSTGVNRYSGEKEFTPFSEGVSASSESIEFSAEENNEIFRQISASMAPNTDVKKSGGMIASGIYEGGGNLTATSIINSISSGSNKPGKEDEVIDTNGIGEIPIHVEGGEGIATIDGRNLKVEGPAHGLDIYGAPTEEGGVRTVGKEGDHVYKKGAYAKEYTARVNKLEKLIQEAMEAGDQELVEMLEKTQV